MLATLTRPAPIPSRRRLMTHDLLKRALFLICALDLIFLIMALAGEYTHRGALKTVGRDTVPSIIASQHIKAALSDMDANAANVLLGEPGKMTASVALYQSRREEAANYIVSAAENITFGEKERKPIRQLVLGLVNYHGLIQRAWDLHGRKDPAEMAAYLEAARLLDSDLLPQADLLEKANYEVMDQTYEHQRGVSALSRLGLLAAGLALLFVLVGVQVFLSERTRRTLNPALLGATLFALALLINAVSVFGTDMQQLKIAKEGSFETIHSLWRARADAYAANGLESRYLLDSNNAARDTRQFLTIAGQIGKNIEPDKEASQRFDEYIKIDQQIRQLRQNGKRAEAIALCIGTRPGESNWAFDRFDHALERTIASNQTQFDKALQRGDSALSNFDAKASIEAILIAALAFIGLFQRIREYQ